MFKEIKQLISIKPFNVKVLNSLLFLINREKGNIQCYNLKDFNILWETSNEDFSCDLIKEFIVTSDLLIYNKQGEIFYSNPENIEYSYEFSDNKNLLVFKTVDEEKEIAFYHIFDIREKRFLKKNLSSFHPKLFINKADNVFLFGVVSQNAILFDYVKDTILWQQDLSEKLNSMDADGKAVSPHIRGVLQYKDNLIVYSTGGIASLQIHDGTLNWFTKTYATFLIIENNMGYAATNASIYRVNLENGCVISYEGWEYNGMPYIQYEDIEYWVYCGELVFYNGLLWRYSNFNGRSFIVAINPHDGHYEWVHCADTKGDIISIQFHQDKMFVSDTSDILYIYEKEEIIN